MSEDGFHAWGVQIPEHKVLIPWLKKLKNAAIRHPLVNFRCYVENAGIQGIEIDYSPELPQYPPMPMEKTERLVITLDSEMGQPKVLAMRKAFPVVPHLNASSVGSPRSLCLFEERYRDKRHSITQILFLDRIGEWLTRAAENRLHLVDQPLEPLVQTHHVVIFDESVLWRPVPTNKALIAYSLDDPLNPRALVLKTDVVDRSLLEKHSKGFLPIPIEGKVHCSTFIEDCPCNLEQLSAVLDKDSIDLVELLQKETRRVHADYPRKVFASFWPIVLLKLPKSRTPSGSVETIDWYAFVLEKSIAEVGEAVGCFQKTDKGHVMLLVPDKDRERLKSVSVVAANPVYGFNQSTARRLSGASPDVANGFLVIGLGAIGSQVVLNLARQGYGPWILCDEDRLLPHNLSRHALLAVHLGRWKASTLASEICFLLNDSSSAQDCVLDALSESGVKELEKLTEGVDRVLDFSASAAVSLQLSRIPLSKPCSSVFMTANGRFLVCLSESPDRSIRLGDLETQLAAACIECEPLADVLSSPDSGTVRYSGACNDQTTILSQGLVGVHSGVASGFLGSLTPDAEASIAVWTIEPRRMTIHRQDTLVSHVHSSIKGGWEVRMTERVLCRMRRWRRCRLPNETGGVLLGTIDVTGKIVYIGGALPSPPDSKEWPTCYIRGISGLRKKVDLIRKRSGEHLCYVGEWHSHPSGSGSAPSSDDLAALTLLCKEMGRVGLPAIMAIQGEDKVPHVAVQEEAE